MRPPRYRRARAASFALAALLLGLLGGLAGALVDASPAAAHAELLSTDPGDGVVLDEAPDAVTFQFSEGVDLQPDGVRVLDDRGRRVDRGQAEASGSSVTAPLDDALAQGTYVVAWRVVSADGHPVRGSYTFSVGRESDVSGLAGDAFAAGGDRPIEVGAAVLRVLAYLGVLGSCGVVLVSAVLRRPDEPTPVARWVGAGAVIALVSLVLQAVALGALATGEGLTAITTPGVLGLVLADGFGPAAVVALAGLLGVLITTGLPFEGPARVVALTGAVLAPLSFALTGHTRSMDPAAIGYSADLVHLLAAAVWFGGLGAVTATVLRRRRAGDPMGAAEAVATFSGIAAGAAAAVIVAGTTLAWIEVGGLEALTSTTYGRLLLAKVAAVAVVLGLAAWNRFRLLPLVARDALDRTEGDLDGEGGVDGDGAATGAAAWRSLVRTLRVEGAVLVAVLALTGVLVNVTPAKQAVVPGPVTVTTELGEGSVDVTIDPARAGRNDLHLYLFDAEGRPDDRYDAVALQLRLPEQDLGPFDREPVRAGPGHFQLVGTDLTLSGEWELTIVVKPDRFTETKATVTFDVR